MTTPRTTARNQRLLDRVRKTPRRRLQYRIADEDLYKYPREVLNCYFSDSGVDVEPESKPYVDRIVREWSKPEHVATRLPAGICDMGAGKIKEFKDATEGANLGPNGFRYLRDERERRMNRLQKQNSRRRRGRPSSTTPGSAGTSKSASRTSSSGRRASSRRRDTSTSDEDSGQVAMVHANPSSSLTQNGHSTINSSSLPMYLMSPMPGLDQHTFGDLLQPIFDEELGSTDPSTLLGPSDLTPLSAHSPQTRSRTQQQTEEPASSEQHGMQVISHLNGVPVMMPPGFNMDASALQHMLSTYYGALPVNGGSQGPTQDGAASQDSIEATARALLDSMPVDNEVVQSQLAGLMANDVKTSGEGAAEPDVQRVRDFFASQLAAIKEATGVHFPDDLGQSALDVIAAMAKSVHESERKSGKRSANTSTTPAKGAAKRKKAKRGSDMPPPNKPVGIGNNGGRPPPRKAAPQGPSPLVPPGASSQHVQYLQTVWENKDVIAAFSSELPHTSTATSTTGTAPDPLCMSPAGQMAMRLLQSSDVHSSMSPSQLLNSALFSSSPFRLTSPTVKSAKNGQGLEINGVSIDQLMMISPAKLVHPQKRNPSSADQDGEEVPPTMPTVHTEDTSDDHATFPFPGSPVPTHSGPILVAPSPLPHLITNSPMHYVLSPMSGVPNSAYSLFNTMLYSPAGKHPAFDSLADTRADKDDKNDEQPPVLAPLSSASATLATQGLQIPIPSPSMVNTTTAPTTTTATITSSTSTLMSMSSTTSRLHNRRYSSGRPQASPKSPRDAAAAQRSGAGRDWTAAPLLPANQRLGGDNPGQPLPKRRPSFDSRLDMVIKSTVSITPSRLREQRTSTAVSQNAAPKSTLQDDLTDQHSPTPAELAASEVGVLPLNPSNPMHA
eukprot:m.135289 g.135289  ORF g.135289 m.135289 type:complete len:896 (+) comp15987_c0_seq1:174-2861(+)